MCVPNSHPWTIADANSVACLWPISVNVVVGIKGSSHIYISHEKKAGGSQTSLTWPTEG